MTGRNSYASGDTFRWAEYEVVAASDNGNGCDGCIGMLSTDICNELPGGCNIDEIIWKPHNDAAKVIHVLLKLEGKNLYD